ncbi:MAG: hypothetical protein ABH813_02175 [Patescibacteria group bacterium]
MIILRLEATARRSPPALESYGETQYNKKMFGKLENFIKNHQGDIILFFGVILISLFSFAMGYIFAKQQDKEPIKIENPKSEARNPKLVLNFENYTSRDNFYPSGI